MQLTNYDYAITEMEKQKRKTSNALETGISGRPVVGQKDVFTKLSLLFSDRSVFSKPVKTEEDNPAL